VEGSGRGPTESSILTLVWWNVEKEKRYRSLRAQILKVGHRLANLSAEKFRHWQLYK
jgi:hypothetical protein